MALLAGSLAVLLASSVANAAVQDRGLFTVPNTFPNLQACLAEPLTYSCENTTVIQNTCCSPTPGGLGKFLILRKRKRSQPDTFGDIVLQTQFWSTWTGLERKGQLLPKGSWTIHGLWPDNCDGSFEQYCDFSRQFDPAPSPKVLPNGTTVPVWTGPGVDSFVAEFKRFDLLDYMSKYWINQGAPNADFWAHEFSKHATCTSTFDVACYGPDYKKNQDVVDFFDAVVRAFKQYPTFDMLASAGIVPSNKTTYSLTQLQTALKAQTGATPYLGCGVNGTVLQEVWYFSHVLGSEQFGHFKPLDSTTKSSCSSTAGIHYYERTASSELEVRLLP
ncbi:hypothetical protein QCA50_002515 [Cerrena zonata]|uniref:ribonuclease T2 n=1 Tax=Cerrena zonata TaxID=2478898 RepID=A0AAW0GTR6_9APHY